LNNFHIYYIAILVIFGMGIIAISSGETNDPGECKLNSSGDVVVRKSSSQSFVESEYCIIIYS